MHGQLENQGMFNALEKAMTEIFVFGSNLAGRHGKGAAADALHYYGAEYGVGVGRTGNAYAIPTKDEFIRTLPVNRIRPHVEEFVRYAKAHPELNFRVTRVGCGLAGYRNEDIAPMFVGVPENCELPEEWKDLIP